MVQETLKRSVWPIASAWITSVGILFGITQGLGLVGVEIVKDCVLGAFVPSLSIFWVYYRRDLRFQNFFGLAADSVINVILSTYQNRTSYQDTGPPQNRERYFKEVNGQTIYLVGAQKHLVGLETATTGILSLLELGKLTSHQINVVGDEEESKIVDGAIICLGSPTSNFITKRILDNLPKDVRITFTTGTMSCWIHPAPYTSTTQKDYAVLARIIEKERVSFVCAGIDEQGTVAVARFLLGNWQKLPTSQFVQIFECDKMSLAVDKRGGKHIDKKQGIWRTD